MRARRSRVPLVRAVAMVFTAAWLASAMACGGAQTDEPPQRVGPGERALACDTLLHELYALDLELASESDLETWRARGESRVDDCSVAWLDEARTLAQTVMARHRAGELWIRTLFVEAALARRFDGFANYCAIVQDTFEPLFVGIADIEAALVSDDVDDEERRQLIQLRDLDLEAIDVLAVAADAYCDADDIDFDEASSPEPAPTD